MITDLQFSIMLTGIYLVVAVGVGYYLQMNEPDNDGSFDVLQLVLLAVMGLFWPVVFVVWLYSRD